MNVKLIVGLGTAVLISAGATYAWSVKSVETMDDSACVSCGAGSTVAPCHEAEDGEVEVTLDEVPDAVRATILEHVDADAITEIVIDTEHGVRAYEIESGNTEFRVGLDGAYLGEEDDDEDEGPDDADDR